MNKQDKNHSNREDVPTNSEQVQKNVHGQGQQDGFQETQDEFLDFDLDYKADFMDGDVQSQSNNDSELVRKWEKIRPYFMTKYPGLTGLDVTHGEGDGDFNQMLGRIEKKTGKNKEQLRREIIEWDEMPNL